MKPTLLNADTAHCAECGKKCGIEYDSGETTAAGPDGRYRTYQVFPETYASDCCGADLVDEIGNKWVPDYDDSYEGN